MLLDVARLQEIGSRMVACPRLCEGIERDPDQGIIPRGLIIEEDRRNTNGAGCVVVGLNPGKAKRRERDLYTTHASYECTIEFWREHLAYGHKYYEGTRGLVDQLGLDGPIVWTELAKCQNLEGTAVPPLQTLRTCVTFFLREEVECIPREWPLIALGREAYKALAYLFVDRIVIGIPHPTGSHGDFNRLFVNRELQPQFRDVLRVIAHGDAARVVWVNARGGCVEGVRVPHNEQ